MTRSAIRRQHYQRTKAGLAVAKQRGVKLGTTGAEILAPKYRAEAKARAEQLAPMLRDMLKSGYTMSGIADALTEQKMPTVSGGAWHPQTVIRIVERLGA